MELNDLAPNKGLHRRIRAGFILKGTTFTAWCRQHEINENNARSANIGAWDGPKGRALRERLIDASGLAGRVEE